MGKKSFYLFGLSMLWDAFSMLLTNQAWLLGSDQSPVEGGQVDPTKSNTNCWQLQRNWFPVLHLIEPFLKGKTERNDKNRFLYQIDRHFFLEYKSQFHQFCLYWLTHTLSVTSHKDGPMRWIKYVECELIVVVSEFGSWSKMSWVRISALRNTKWLNAGTWSYSFRSSDAKSKQKKY